MPQQQRTYEVMFIVRPDLLEEETERVVSTVESSATTAGITVKNVERMGKRRLAYKVRKFQDGIYVLLTIAAPGGAVAELERRLRVTEPVIKYITVRVDEEQKRLGKIKKIRDSKVRQHPHSSEGATGSEPAQVTA
jgi:small subunit ribosomal protein S6